MAAPLKSATFDLLAQYTTKRHFVFTGSASNHSTFFITLLNAAYSPGVRKKSNLGPYCIIFLVSIGSWYLISLPPAGPINPSRPVDPAATKPL
jgi:hypothetical protein